MDRYRSLSILVLAILLAGLVGQNQPILAAPTAITVAITTPTNGQVVTTSSVTFTGTSSPGSTLSLSIDGGAAIPVTADAAGNWSYTATLPDGPHTATVNGVRETTPTLWMSVIQPSTAPDQVVAANPLTGAVLARITLSADAVEGLDISRDQTKVYACHGGGVDIISTSTYAIIGTVALNAPPQLCRLNPSGSELWITQPAINQMAVMNTTTNAVSYIALANGAAPHDVVFSPDGQFAYTANTEAVNNPSTITKINTTTRAVVAQVGAGTTNRHMAISGDGTRLYISAKNSSRVYVFNAATMTQVAAITISAFGDTEDVVLKTDGSRLYVSQQTTSNIAVINTATNALVPGEQLASTNLQAVINAITTHRMFPDQLFVGNADDVDVFDIPSRTLVAAQHIQHTPAGTGSRTYEFAWQDRFDTASSTVSFSVNTTADLAIVKSHVGNFVVGQQGQYALVVSNAGPATAVAPIQVTDTLPAGLTYVSATGTGWSCSAVGQAVTCTRSTDLAAGATAPTITVTVNVGAAAAPGVTNRACVDSPSTVDPNPANDCDDDSTTVIPQADISIVKSHTGNFVVGQTGQYALVVSNAGPNTAAAPIQVTDTLPAGLTFVSGTGTGWTCSAAGQAVTCTRSTALAAGATAPTITITVNVGAAAAPGVVNRACASSATQDPNPANDCDDDSTTVIPQADVSIIKSHVGNFVVGQTGQYALVVSNAGPNTAAAPIQVTDTLPAGLTFVSGTGTGWSCSAAGQAVTCTRSTALAAGATAPTITITVNVGAAAAPGVVNRACASSATQDPNPANDCDDDSTTVIPQADISIVKSHIGNFVVGQTGQYSLVVSNAGPNTAAAPIQVTDTLPAGLSFVSGAGTGWSCSAVGQAVTCTNSAAIAAGATAPTLTITVNVGAAAAPGVVNRACASSATQDPNPANDCDDDSTTVIPQADISIVKSHTGNFTVGQQGQYALVVSNAGPNVAVAPIQVTDTLPGGLTFVSGSGTGWSCSAVGQAVTCTSANDIPVGASATTITLTVDVGPAAAPGVVNRACASSTTGDPNPANDCDDDNTTIIPQADLSIIKSHVGDFVVGQQGTYSLVVSNAGPNTASAPIQVTDTLPAGLTFVSGTGTGWNCTISGQDVLCITFTALPSGATAPTITITVDVGPVAAPSVVNRACVSSATGDPDPSDDCDDDGTTVLVPALVIQKQANPVSGTTVAANNLITYTLEVRNTGTAPLTGVVITDAIPLATEYVVGTATPAPASGPDPLVWSIGNLAVGGQASVSFTVRVLPIGTTVAITNTAHTDSNETSPVESNEVLHPFDPTAITMLGMSAIPESGGIRVAWTTGSEAGTLGFQVFRASSQDRSAAVQVTTALLPSQGAAGGDYSFLDTTAPATGRFYYWIVELETNGTTTHDYGPVAAARGYSLFLPVLQR